jgi:type I restriction enzyme S subunit
MNRELKFIKFSAVAEFRNGVNFGKDSHGTGCLLVGVPSFAGRSTPDWNSLKEINPDGVAKPADYLRKGDIVFVRSNGNKALVGRSLYIDSDIEALFSGFCIRARFTSSDIDSKFCVYYTKTKTFRSQISSSAGTSINNLNQGILADVEIPFFSKPDQQKIAKVLSTLDAKIELNNQINAELEAMTKLLYDYWFVQFDFPMTAEQASALGQPELEGKPYKTSGGKMVFNPTLKRDIPAGWKNGTLQHFIISDKTGDWGKDSTEGNYTERVTCIRGTDLNALNGAGLMKSPTRYILRKNSHKQLVPNDVIVEISGGSPTQSTGRAGMITEQTLERFADPLICSNFCKAIKIKNSDSLHYFMRTWRNLYDHGVLFSWEGKTSGIKNLLFDSFITHHKVAIPPEDLITRFAAVISPQHAEIQKLLIQNQELTKLRDWLLPMLMNGQVTVSD